MQNGGVKHSNGSRRDDHVTVPNAVIPLHADRGPIRHHHSCDARAHRLRGGDPPMARRQVRLPRLHVRIRRRRLRQHRNRPNPSRKYL